MYCGGGYNEEFAKLTECNDEMINIRPQYTYDISAKYKDNLHN